MSTPPRRQFLAQQGYRRRRLVDLLRVVPVVGLLLWLVPLVWPRGGTDVPTTSVAILYIFGVWLALVAGAALLARALERAAPEATEPD